eukprot:TRINITY_DN5287_c0_g1_i2.p3 TRINITY_DN5287_c0_g1~~TRINITY_DN5287_c0_g1_i2.p3  ORF type:complete len:110 (+),score=24.60 TRINITY_DN5287_c0_g1_i2:72-401(+)
MCIRDSSNSRKMVSYVEYLERSVRNPIKLNMLDIILIQQDTMLAYKWIFTNSEGFVKFQELKPLPFAEIAKSLLTNLSLGGTELAEYRRIVNWWSNFWIRRILGRDTTR